MTEEQAPTDAVSSASCTVCLIISKFLLVATNSACSAYHCESMSRDVLDEAVFSVIFNFFSVVDN